MSEPETSVVSSTTDDQRFMRLALALGRRGLGNTWPNPAVGAVLVKDGVIVGRGWTQPGGRPHAETEALRRAKRAAKGATLYVTLEPCSHEGKTPPCADAIIKAGVARVVSALEDPNPEVAGQGHARLREAGITVDVGLCADEARAAHAGHIGRIASGRPHVTLKLAVSADGKAGFAGRKPAPITEVDARDRVFMVRYQNDAILVGLGTILSDNPQLTTRLPGLYERSPVRVVLDANLRTPLSLSVVSTVGDVPTWIFCSKKASEVAEDFLTQKGCKVFRVDDTQGRLDLDEIMKVLAENGITRLMVEGGPTVAASFAAADMVDEFVLFRGSRDIGDKGIDPLEGMPLDKLTGALRLIDSQPLGPDTVEHYVRA
ncbi:MAG: bifunctional diaminohydroxyphosphoribosylaminopyrimidine deaminase/5-amino-6-(5-phosphoribosylamino)uracil reductase RibD [Proteobacteria bacterium]|nr:bifunctional diaminohydroxyphosphoribosylaminopyrimidine deaminase/5-amino-6-(5-phosphoribosylamino)uracil reductase RibD [Pseudomonadota bacterium]